MTHLSPSLYQLPNELSLNILEKVDRKTLLSVLRVSSALREIGEPLLYHTVVLKPFSYTTSTEHAITCLRAISKKESLMLAVRQLTIYFGYQYGADGEARPECVADELLEALHMVLPKLSRVVKLDISRASDLPTATQPPRCNAPLQSLRHYLGPPEILEGTDTLPLLSVAIRSNQNVCGTVRSALLRISQFCGPTLKVLRLHQNLETNHLQWTSLIAEIPNLFPNLVTLDLDTYSYLNDESIDEMCQIMVNLKRLRLLQVSNLWNMSVEQEGNKVERLHIGCPQLRAISIEPHRSWRFSEKYQEWLCDPENAPWQDENPPRSPEDWLEADYEQRLADPLHEGFDWGKTSWRTTN